MRIENFASRSINRPRCIENYEIWWSYPNIFETWNCVLVLTFRYFIRRKTQTTWKSVETVAFPLKNTPLGPEHEHTRGKL